MPKISVHLEADSAEEFLALLDSFKINTSRPVEYVRRELETVAEPVQDGEAPEASQGPSEAEGPAGIPLEQLRAPKRRGRPAKAAPVEPEPEPPVAVQPEPEVAQPAAEVVAAPEVAAPKPAKPKAMPHAQPENGAATRQDLLDAFSEYVQRYGASFGFSDISSLLQKNLGDGVRKASDVPEDKLPVAIGAIKTAIADNPFNRKRDYA